MPNESDLIGDVRTGGVAPFSNVQITRTESAPRLAEVADLVRTVRDLGPRTTELRRAALTNRWEELQRAAVSRDGRTLLAELGDAGLAWRDVARLAGVSVPAVQKWRRGEGITGANRLKLAGIVALLTYLRDTMIHEPVSWLEIPIRPGVAVTPLDLLAARRYDLVLELASDEYASSVETRTEVLDEFDPAWRTTRVDEQFEVYVASDGIPAIRPRS